MELPRVTEPEPDSPQQEAREYADMDHASVNRKFVDDLLSGVTGPRVLDLGCGPAGIPIELCKREESVEMIAVDAEVEMLELAKLEIDFAGMLDRISLQHASATDMKGFEDGMADTVISNSLLHHLDEPEAGLATAVRLLKQGGRLFVRDLARPDSTEAVEALVSEHCGGESEYAQQLFRQSLHAALTLQEIRTIAGGLGIESDDVQMTSDRHWTIDWTRKD